MTTEDNRKLLLDTYNDLQKKGSLFVESLYMLDCLRASGFKDAEALDHIDLLRSLWIKDETDTSIGRLSDYLFQYVNEVDDYKEKSVREILSDIRFYNDLDKGDYESVD